MKRKRHSPEQIVQKLRGAAKDLEAGLSLEEVCRKMEVSIPTYHRWNKEP